MSREIIKVSRRKKGEFFTGVEGQKGEYTYYDEEQGKLRFKLLVETSYGSVSVKDETLAEENGKINKDTKLELKMIQNGVINRSTSMSLSRLLLDMSETLNRNFAEYQLISAPKLEGDWRTVEHQNKVIKYSGKLGVECSVYSDEIKYECLPVRVNYILLDVKLYDAGEENEAVKKQALRAKIIGVNMTTSGEMTYLDLMKQCYKEDTKTIHIPDGLKSVDMTDLARDSRDLNSVVLEIVPSKSGLKANPGQALALGRSIISKVNNNLPASEVGDEVIVNAEKEILDLNASTCVTLTPKASVKEVVYKLGSLRIKKKDITEHIKSGERYLLKEKSNVEENKEKIYIEDVTDKAYDKDEYKEREVVYGIDYEDYSEVYAKAQAVDDKIGLYYERIEAVKKVYIDHFDSVGYPGDNTKESYLKYLGESWYITKGTQLSTKLIVGDRIYKIVRILG